MKVIYNLLICFFFLTILQAQDEADSEIKTPCEINSYASIEFSNCSAELSNRLRKWNDYTEPRRFLQHLQVQMSYASGTASKMGAMEALFEQVGGDNPRLYAMRLMHLHYKDAYADLKLRWDTTASIIKTRPELETQVCIDVQEIIKPYMDEWIRNRLEAFESELKKIDPEFE